MNKQRVARVADFITRMIIMFTTILTLLYFSQVFTKQSLVFAALTLSLLISIIVKGAMNIGD